MKYEKPNQDTLKTTLTPLQYEVTQNNATEPPFKNEYDQHFESGIYALILFLKCLDLVFHTSLLYPLPISNFF